MRAWWLVFLVALAAAPALAKPVSAEDAARFEVGSASYADVTASLGKPMVNQSSSDGTRTIIYIATKSHVKAATFIPLVGGFAGGSTGDMTAVSFTFGPDGKLKSYTTSGTHVDCHAAFVGAKCTN